MKIEKKKLVIFSLNFFLNSLNMLIKFYINLYTGLFSKLTYTYNSFNG